VTNAALAAALWLAWGSLLGRGPEVVSPLGDRFYARPDEKGAVAEAEGKLAADPGNVDLVIALGRAQVGVLRLHEAIETFTRGIALAPQNARLYRLRGHRYISSRQFDRGAADLTRAAELSGHEFDIWYHLGTAWATGTSTTAARTGRGRSSARSWPARSGRPSASSPPRTSCRSAPRPRGRRSHAGAVHVEGGLLVRVAVGAEAVGLELVAQAAAL
jgi:cytochrome c-type biogenesis protein CcmH/NrfG